MECVHELTPALGAGAACRAMSLYRSAPMRHQARMHRAAPVGPLEPRAARPRPPLALDAHEKQVLLDSLNSERFVDTAPAAVHATLLDEGRYLGSVRTMYRLLAIHDGCRARRHQLAHPAYTKPEPLALAPNRVWSWDITKLNGTAKWTCFHLYVILDIFSRHVVGWLIAERESAELAEQLIADTVARHDVEPDVLTLHADRGASMRSKRVAALLVDLDIAKSRSPPHVSDDNPYSESQFKTMKYRPDSPARFGCIEDARAHCRAFFTWYNTAHRHSGIGYMTPHSVHCGHAEALRDGRQAPSMLHSLLAPRASGAVVRSLMRFPPQRGSIRHRMRQRPFKSRSPAQKLLTPGAAKSLTCSAPPPADSNKRRVSKVRPAQQRRPQYIRLDQHRGRQACEHLTILSVDF
jgi:putative transposase